MWKQKIDNKPKIGKYFRPIMLSFREFFSNYDKSNMRKEKEKKVGI